MGLLSKLSDLVAGKTTIDGPPRSDKWPGVRALFLKLHPTCTACGGTSKLEVHHINPFHLHPELELDQTNFITLCESDNNGINCHLNLGHSGDFKSWNVNVVSDAAGMMLRITTRPKEEV